MPVKLYYKKHGNGPPLIILHGLLGSSVNWNTLGKKLAESFSVYFVDQRNHGLSPHSDEFNMNVMSEDLYELIIDNHINDAIIMGHSMGGKTAMTFAFEHPDKVSRLIIVDTPLRTYPIDNMDTLNVMISIDLNILKSRIEVDKKLSLTIGNKKLRHFLMQNLYWKEKKQLAWRANLSAIKTNLHTIGSAINNNKKFDKPTLFIRGELSDHIIDNDINLISKIFPNSKLQTIPNAGHWVHADAPSELLKCVISFIQT